MGRGGGKEHKNECRKARKKKARSGHRKLFLIIVET